MRHLRPDYAARGEAFLDAENTSGAGAEVSSCTDLQCSILRSIFGLWSLVGLWSFSRRCPALGARCFDALGIILRRCAS